MSDTREIGGPAAVASTGSIRRATDRAAAQGTRRAERAAETDRVTTEASAELEAAVARARDEAAGARAAQLAEIEAAVRKGTYRPDPARIAERILEDAELIARLHAMLDR
ncbi:flagellar biosynthesis anti-sigma factor FlgM [Vulgatibacter sp.]|uniref:flagellar biosynthesis anti-sigma factor FlgM n=1 Tax=Vulgatibacter sp. TaxID=1971226 RepID=UPI003565C8CE